MFPKKDSIQSFCFRPIWLTDCSLFVMPVTLLFVVYYPFFCVQISNCVIRDVFVSCLWPWVFHIWCRATSVLYEIHGKTEMETKNYWEETGHTSTKGGGVGWQWPAHTHAGVRNILDIGPERLYPGCEKASIFCRSPCKKYRLRRWILLYFLQFLDFRPRETRFSKGENFHRQTRLPLRSGSHP